MLVAARGVGPGRVVGAALLALTLGVGTAACVVDDAGDGPDIATGAQPVLVGAAAASDTVVGLVVDDETATFALYVCGGVATYASHSRWFFGSVALDGAMAATRDGWTLAATRSADGELSVGTLEDPAGAREAFTAAAAEPGRTGLYTAVDAGCRTGVVVLDDGHGTSPRVQGTWCNSDGLRAQVIPLPGGGLDEQRLEVAVTVAGAERRFFAAAASLPLP